MAIASAIDSTTIMAVAAAIDVAKRDMVAALAADGEITLEANPGTVDARHFAGYRAAGVNRLSIGVQSLDDDRLRALGRIHGAGDAIAAVSAIMAQPVTPCALEFMDGTAIDMVREFSDLQLPPEVGALLMIEVDGPAAGIEANAKQIVAAARGKGCVQIDTARTDEEVDRLWRTRKALSPALRNVAPKKINEDVVVPVSEIPALIGGLKALSDEYQVTIVNFGHAGNGNIHVNLLVDPDDPLQMAQAGPCLDAVFNLVLSLGGSLSGEHGIGWVKREFVGRELDSTSLRLMAAIKRQFDPDNILNPGVGLPDS